MRFYKDQKKIQIYKGDALRILKKLPAKCIDTCITSPPYFNLRDYETAEWIGGDPDCDHIEKVYRSNQNLAKLSDKWDPQGKPRPSVSRDSETMTVPKATQYKNTCPKCGAKRKDKQVGLEETPEEYVQNLVNIFKEVRRVLKDDGTVWLNIGDTYATKDYENIKLKDLIGIPFRTAFALQKDGWYFRQDIIWEKPDCMPESVSDRCTKSHEYIFLLSKSKQYYYDAESIKEEAIHKMGVMPGVGGKKYTKDDNPYYATKSGKQFVSHGKRNKRSVWTVNTANYKGAHFAIYPIDLIKPCILAGSREGGTVLDPFGGSGTTGLCAYNLGRNAILVELNKSFIDIAEKRIGKEHGLFGNLEIINE